MSPSFSIGESAQVRTDVPNVRPDMRQYLGDHVVVESLPQPVEGHREPMYLVRSLTDLSCFLAGPSALCKLPPNPSPPDMLDTMEQRRKTRWSECPWRPATVRESIETVSGPAPQDLAGLGYARHGQARQGAAEQGMVFR